MSRQAARPENRMFANVKCISRLKECRQNHRQLRDVTLKVLAVQLDPVISTYGPTSLQTISIPALFS